MLIVGCECIFMIGSNVHGPSKECPRLWEAVKWTYLCTPTSGEAVSFDFFDELFSNKQAGIWSSRRKRRRREGGRRERRGGEGIVGIIYPREIALFLFYCHKCLI